MTLILSDRLRSRRSCTAASVVGDVPAMYLMFGLAWSTSSTSLSCTSLPVSPYLVATTLSALSLVASRKPLLPASTQPAPGGPGNQATSVSAEPFGCSLAMYALALYPIVSNDTSDFAARSFDDMPLITSITG